MRIRHAQFYIGREREEGRGVPFTYLTVLRVSISATVRPAEGAGTNRFRDVCCLNSDGQATQAEKSSDWSQISSFCSGGGYATGVVL
jgi:hypothetical protein